MNILQGSFVVLNLGTDGVKYLWNGAHLNGVVKMFVYKGVSVTLTVTDKTAVPTAELKAYGIKVKEI